MFTAAIRDFFDRLDHTANTGTSLGGVGFLALAIVFSVMAWKVNTMPVQSLALMALSVVCSTVGVTCICYPSAKRQYLAEKKPLSPSRNDSGFAIMALERKDTHD